MSALALALLACIFCAVSAFASMMGVGGGFFFTPLQALFGSNVHTAAATSQFVMTVLSISATVVYTRARKIDWKTAIFLQSFLVSGSFIGGYASKYIPAEPVMILLCIAVLAAAVSMFLPRQQAERDEMKVSRLTWQRELGDERYGVNVLIAMPMSFVAGVASGILGIGGGIITVPMMHICFGIPMDITIATSAFMIGPTALSGAVGHALAGHMDWKSALILAPGTLIGARLGAKFMLKTDRAKLKKVFALLLLVVAVALIIKTAIRIWGT